MFNINWENTFVSSTLPRNKLWNLGVGVGFDEIEPNPPPPGTHIIFKPNITTLRDLSFGVPPSTRDTHSTSTT